MSINYEYGITAKSVEFKDDGRMILWDCKISYNEGPPIEVDYIVAYPTEEES